MSPAHRLDPLLRPRSVAIVGASATPETVGFESLNNLIRGRYSGTLYPVNPRYESLASCRCYATLDELPEVPDLVIFAISDERLEAALDAAIAAGVPAVSIMSALISDDDASLRRQGRPTLRERVTAKLREASILVCGGNAMGFFNFRDRVWAGGFETRAHRLPGNVSFLSQSGSGMCGIVDTDARIDFNFVVSSGQELTVTLADYLDFVLDLPDTRVVGLFLETLHDTPAFLRALAKAREKRIPLVALKTGRTRFAAELAVSHAGALAGDDAAYGAMFERYGVQRVSDMDELATAMILFSHGPRPGPGALVSLHDSGGERQLLVDLAEAEGVALTRLEARTVSRLEKILDPGLPAVNPLDGWSRGGAGAASSMQQSLATLLGDPGAACGALIHDRGPDGKIYRSYVEYLEFARKHNDKPLALVASRQGTGRDDEVERVTRELGIPVLDGIRSYLAGVRCLFGFRDFCDRPALRPPALPERALAAWREALSSPHAIDEARALELLAGTGIATPRFAIATTDEQAVALWQEFGGPVAAKTAAGGIAHKSDSGGVVLGLDSAGAVRDAYRRLASGFGPRVMIAAMAPDGIELFLGMTRDRDLGPIVVIGFGGIHAEVLNDVVCALPPIDAAEARRLIGRLRLGALLDGVRGAQAADVESFAQAAARFSVLVAALGEGIAAIDVNPLVVHAQGCTAVDALVVATGGASARGSERPPGPLVAEGTGSGQEV